MLSTTGVTLQVLPRLLAPCRALYVLPKAPNVHFCVDLVSDAEELYVWNMALSLHFGKSLDMCQ